MANIEKLKILDQISDYFTINKIGLLKKMIEKDPHKIIPFNLEKQVKDLKAQDAYSERVGFDLLKKEDFLKGIGRVDSNRIVLTLKRNTRPRNIEVWFIIRQGELIIYYDPIY